MNCLVLARCSIALIAQSWHSMFVLKPSSEKAKARIVWPDKLGERKSFKLCTDRSGLPFKSMTVGQSFFMQFNETTPAQISEAIKRARLFNRKFNVWFEIVKHKDAFEIARLE